MSKYDKINFSPPDGVKAACRAGLKLHEEGKSGDGLEPATVLWARKYVNGESVSPERARQGYKFTQRNARFADAAKDSPAWVAWQLWGGKAGASWFSKLWKQMEAVDNADSSSINIFPQEIEDGLSELLSSSEASCCFAEALIIDPISFDSEAVNSFKTKQQIDSFKDQHNYVDFDISTYNGIMVTANWNKNDDIFTAEEIKNRFFTPFGKGVNFNHNGRETKPKNELIGFISDVKPVDKDYVSLLENDSLSFENDFYGLLIEATVWSRNWPSYNAKVIDGIANGTMFFSMEVAMKDYGYGIRESTDDKTIFIPRSAETAYLSKYLRIFGGSGFVNIDGKKYQIGRWIRNLTFTGVAFVERPGDPKAILFEELISNASEVEIKNSGVQLWV